MSWRKLALVCAITALWAVNFGVGSQAVTHWLKHRNVHDTFVGLVHAGYYVGVACAAALRAAPDSAASACAPRPADSSSRR